ncbi:TonB-dependent siderophore receptor [Ramlibacter sp. G-1-2-2]|uniref:TonB-dependent siderophore receptor n=1 Tax=Ramlibacter agri TaxID=2728837 RepID=A0A848HEN1_9BURK|nr:TonB-dependent siderophore receptor [Ramlibacter agri]NML46048.1 TonB-dependent siderophore receptor [Ramlibacter agri]
MAQQERRSSSEPALLPLGAMLLAASASAWSQAADPTPTLKTVTVTETVPQGKDTLKTDTTNIGKGKQELRDIPQSLTVVTEKLIDDRNLDTVKDVLRNTAGVTFQAAEGGEEDIRLRGFSLAATGDIYLDGMRDPAFYDRDTFNLDRIEVLRGSASMLFGHGSTGGVVNQASKLPMASTQHEVITTIGSHDYGRITGDFNIQTGEEAGLRLNVMRTKADNNGSGSSIDKEGLALGYRTGIDSSNEFAAQLYYLNNNNGVNYGLPWIKPSPSSSQADSTIWRGVDPTNYYGMASDRNDGMAKWAGLAYTHRFAGGSEWRTQVRKGWFERDQRASAIRFANTAGTSLENLGPNTVLTRGLNVKIQNLDTTYLQSDFSGAFKVAGYENQVLTGIDLAREQKTVFQPLTAAQGGIVPVKPNTLVGTPDDGAWVNEDLRTLRVGNQFVNKSMGAYAQDMVTLAPHWKVLGGLRYDWMDGDYDNYPTPGTAQSYQQKISDWSKRVGVLYQPTAQHSFHFSWGTSFNTSGDTYSYNAQSANTPPEQSENLELGGRIDSADKRFSTRFALFRSTKTNERNTDPDTAATRLLLTGKRHTAGVELDAVGRITRQWEMYLSYMWMPIAVVDEAASTATSAGNRVGDRPGLSPRHSGTVWTTYQLTPQWRVGGGVNFRSKQSPADTTPPAWNAPGFGTVDLLAEYTINDRYSIRGNVTNVGNKYYADSLYRGHYVPGAGRLVQLTLTARFL